MTRDLLLEEVLHPRTGLHLIPVITIRGKHPLLRREEGARGHSAAVRSAPPPDVRAPVSRGESCRLTGPFFSELGDA